MSDLSVNRTLVKSPPELWSRLSELESLAQHLGEFGEIRITRLEPEHTIAWEGDHARGTVAIEASGWGTKVTMTVAIADAEPSIEVEEREAPSIEDPASDPILEPSTAELAAIEFTAASGTAEAAPGADRPEPEVVEQGPSRRGFFRRFFGRRKPERAPDDPPQPHVESPSPAAPAVREPVSPEPAPEPAAREPGPEPSVGADPVPAAMGEQRALEVLGGALDDLGAAHHRPFSRG